MAFGSRRPTRGEPRTPPRQPARNYALWLLSQREYSAQALEERLIKRGYPKEEAQAALELLQRHGLQSDERFASMKARSSASRAGNRRIAMQLGQAGIAPELIEAQLQTLDAEEERARDAARRFEGAERDARTRNRFWRYLASRGFSLSVVAKVWASMSDVMRPPGADDSDAQDAPELPDEQPDE